MSRFILISALFVGFGQFTPTLLAESPAEVSDRLDALLEGQWKKADVPAAAMIDDAAFCRRVGLALAGRTPAALPAREFLDRRDANKRIKLVESLLKSDEFADHWGRVLTQGLTAKRPIRHEKYDGRILHEYLRDSLAANKSYKQIVTELICGEGMRDRSGPANFLLRYEAKPADLAGAVAKRFLGVSLQCAQCHDHPFTTWKKDDFWGVAAFFGRLKMMEQSDGDDGEYFTAVLEARRGDLLLPDPKAKPDDKGKTAKKKILPRLPGAKETTVMDNRRQVLADWITAKDNPYFARHAVNLVWSQLFGAGLLRSLDNLEKADAQRLAVLDLLAKDFTANGHDLKRLLRVLVLSKVFQRAAAGAPKEEVRHHQLEQFARFGVRPLSVDQLYQSIAQATGHQADEEEPPADKAEEAEDDGYSDKPVELLGERALTVQRSLALMNSEFVHQAVKVGAKAANTAHGPKVGPEHIEWLFLATLARRPTADESAAMLKLAKDDQKKGRGLEDVLWVLLNSAEFTTNH
jgi:hypothetical protein